jgi:hypothetical protein
MSCANLTIRVRGHDFELTERRTMNDFIMLLFALTFAVSSWLLMALSDWLMEDHKP